MSKIICAINLELSYFPQFITQVDADELFHQLNKEIEWKQDSYTFFGKQVSAPRLTAWYGDAGADYTYSGLRHKPSPWSESLLNIKQRVEETARRQFNSVLLNLYRNGEDSIGWHTDAEPELGNEPVIASLSLGATRNFSIKHKVSKESMRIPLQHGDLLIMSGPTQQYWEHALPKQKTCSSPRINLTFRYVNK